MRRLCGSVPDKSCLCQSMFAKMVRTRVCVRVRTRTRERERERERGGGGGGVIACMFEEKKCLKRGTRKKKYVIVCKRKKDVAEMSCGSVFAGRKDREESVFAYVRIPERSVFA